MTGAHLIVHNKTHKPNFYEGIALSVGAFSHVSVNRRVSSRLEKPYSPCVKNIEAVASQSIYVQTLLNASITYTQADCFNVCLQKYIVEYCFCYSLEFPYWYLILKKFSWSLPVSSRFFIHS